MTAEGATFPGHDTPDTAALRERAELAGTAFCYRGTDILALCDALDAATARAEAAEATANMRMGMLSAARERAEAAEADRLMSIGMLDSRLQTAEAERDRARGTAAALEAEVARYEADPLWRSVAVPSFPVTFEDES